MKLALVNLAKDLGDPPLGLAYLAAYLRETGVLRDTVLIDQEDPLNVIEREKPDVVGISALSYLFPEANQLAGVIRSQYGIPVIIGGNHITAMPHHLKDSHFDIAVLGEGEETMAELMQLLQTKGQFTLDELRKIKGLVFRNECGENERTERRPLIDPLDTIPFPARDLLPMRQVYLAPRKAAFPKLGVYAGMLSSRGCPYECAFCSPREFWLKFRPMSPHRVVEEISFLVEEYRLDGVMLWDDLFTVNKKRLNEIVELIEQRGINSRIEFAVFARANLIDEETVQLLQRMHVTSVIFGLESGSDRILRYLKKSAAKVEDNYRALRLCKQYGMRTRGTVILGAPEETEEDIALTERLFKSPDLDEPIVCHLTPLPGTDVWQLARSQGLVRDDINWDYASLADWGFHRELIVNRHLPPDRLEQWFYELNDWAHQKARREGIRAIRFKTLLDPRFVKRVAMNYRKYARRLLSLVTHTPSSGKR